MSKLASLAKDTAIYGLSSIIGRFLNYWLVPLYTRVMPASEGGYGVVTEVYAWTAFWLVILTFGMETTFFRFANKEENRSPQVYATVLKLVGGVCLAFIILGLCFLQPISEAMGYANHPWWIGMMMLVVAMDSFQCIPFAYLRYQKRPWHFASLKLLGIATNITANLIYYVCMGGRDIGMVFVINLGCTTLTMLLLLPQLRFREPFDKTLARHMLGYALPILLLGIAGILNQVADKMIFKHIYPGTDGEVQLGIYGAATKIAMIMAMLTQAFRYAYEPFVFARSRDADKDLMYANTMKYFVVFTLLAFLVVVCYIDVLKYIIDSHYWEGLKVVPIVMAAEIMMGIYFNLSFWYKLTDETHWGAVFSFIGCAVLIVINLVFVPRYGYMACAWAGCAGYATAMLLSYFVGQRHYPIPYPLRQIGLYVALATTTYAITTLLPPMAQWLTLVVNTLLLSGFAIVVVRREFWHIIKQKRR
ncbi:MAG: lipopolysaccharide biosynthesis protein [Bacteroidales bacterium]|nr:lipopolysaccharide biosynthesis protein [Bacteroidales bacterium]